jgi:hypothetical protein
VHFELLLKQISSILGRALCMCCLKKQISSMLR